MWLVFFHGDGKSFRKDKLASPPFAANKIRSTHSDNQWQHCLSSQIVVTEIQRRVRRGSSFSGPGFRTACFYLGNWVGSGRQL